MGFRVVDVWVHSHTNLSLESSCDDDQLCPIHEMEAEAGAGAKAKAEAT